MSRYAVQEVNVPLFKPRFQSRRTWCAMIWLSLSIPHRSCYLFFSDRFAALYRSSSVLAYPSFLWQWKGTKRNVSVQTFKIIVLHVSQSPRGPHVWHRDASAYPHSRPEMPWPASPFLQAVTTASKGNIASDFRATRVPMTARDVHEVEDRENWMRGKAATRPQEVQLLRKVPLRHLWPLHVAPLPAATPAHWTTRVTSQPLVSTVWQAPNGYWANIFRKADELNLVIP
jgi:hypothetical protein